VFRVVRGNRGREGALTCLGWRLCGEDLGETRGKVESLWSVRVGRGGVTNGVSGVWKGPGESDEDLELYLTRMCFRAKRFMFSGREHGSDR
jgi:hypothetical protein